MHPPKVVLVASRDYIAQCDRAFLLELINAKVELFCAVGQSAQNWEDEMDWLFIEVKEASLATQFVVTTAHTDESVEEVIAFAEHFDCSRPCSVEVLYLQGPCVPSTT
jgi:hypothetical protein